MEVTYRFDESMDGKVWATVMRNSIELDAANSKGNGCRKRGTGDKAIFHNRR